MADVKDNKAEEANKGEKASASSGIFGFPGTTLFQPGQSKFKGEDGVLPFKPDDIKKG